MDKSKFKDKIYFYSVRLKRLEDRIDILSLRDDNDTELSDCRNEFSKLVYEANGYCKAVDDALDLEEGETWKANFKDK